MIRVLALAVAWLALASAACAAGDSIDELKPQFDYDARQNLDVKATLLYERDGAKVYDVTYSSGEVLRTRWMSPSGGKRT